MVAKKNILTVIAVICMAFSGVNASELVRMDIKKTSENSVDVTFFTTGISANPMVTRKSNNKYVVLMPDVAGKSAGIPDISSVKDIITNVDVKNVDDGLSGYTKVTLITTKPINIRTNLQKTAPVTQEEKEAKALIVQAKTHPRQTVAPIEPKKEEVKAPVAVSSVKSSVETPKIKTQKNNNVLNIKKESKNAPKISIDANDNSKVTKAEEVETQTFLADENVVAETAPIQSTDDDIQRVAESKTSPVKANNAGWLAIMFPLICMFMLAKFARNSVQKSIALKASFKENLSEQPGVTENYEDIINNPELNWQERYRKFVEESKGEIKPRKYTFIKNEEKPIMNETDKKRLELESTLRKTPEVYKPHQIDITETPVNKVVSEDETINKTINTVKLKAFAKPVSLQTSHREKVKKTLPQTSPISREGKFVKLQETALNASIRNFKDANLKVSDLISAGNQYLEDVPKTSVEQGYVMSSVDEYFSLLDKEQSRKMTNPNADLSRKVAAGLASVKPSMKVRKTSIQTSGSNPISQKKKDYLNGLVVKSSYNIDENKGFHIVNLDGVTALVGRIKNEIFVLKKFDTNVEDLRVRYDSENVYIVKAGDFKSLVDVGEDKMGVLLEL